jgi:hypothetical protein
MATSCGTAYALCMPWYQPVQLVQLVDLSLESNTPLKLPPAALPTGLTGLSLHSCNLEAVPGATTYSQTQLHLVTC